MDDGGDAGVDEEFGGVGEGEKGVGAGGGAGEAFGVAVFVRQFDGDLRGHGAGHLARAGGEKLTVFGDGDGVGFDVLGGEPDEGEVGPLGVGGLAEAGDGAGAAGEAGGVGLLDEHAAGDGAVVQGFVGACGGEVAGGEDTAVFPAVLQHGEGGWGVAGGDDDFEEAFAGDDLGGGGFVDFAVEGDDAAEGGDGVTGVGEVEGGGESGCSGAAAGVGVLDDGGGGVGEFADEFDGGVGVEDVDVGEGFAVELFGGGDGGPRTEC